ncbi:MAG TPA: nitroreductase/quinone reductase family protein [Acidimicrobiia bacterium]
MDFDAGDLAMLAETAEVEIETRAADGAVHRTIIWIVVDGTDVFVRSYLGARARWYREALADPTVAVHAGGRRIPCRAVPATDGESVGRASAGLEHKYAGEEETPDMVRPEVLSTTLRLVPD